MIIRGDDCNQSGGGGETLERTHHRVLRPASSMLALLLLAAVGCKSSSGGEDIKHDAGDGSVVGDARVPDGGGADTGVNPAGDASTDAARLDSGDGDGSGRVDAGGTGDGGGSGNGDGGSGTRDGGPGTGDGGSGTGNNGTGDGGSGTGNNGTGDGGSGTVNNGSGDGGSGTGNNGSGDGGSGTGNNGSGDGGSGTGNNGSGDGGSGTGDGGTANGPVSLTTVDFGLSDCGGAVPAPKTITLTNTTGAALTYSATLSSTTSFTLAGATAGVVSGSVAAGQAATLTIFATAVATSATAGVPISANLTFTTNAAAPYDSIVVPVTVTPRGANLTVEPGTTPNARWILAAYNQAALPIPVTLRNTGNAPASVTVTQPTATQFGLTYQNSPATTLSVPAASGGTAGATALSGTFTPTYIGAIASTAGLAVSGAVCNGGTASATQVTFQGTGTGAGFVASASTLAPRVNCGATGASLPTATIAIGNFNDASLTYTATLGPSSAFDLSSAGATLPAQGTTQITVSLKPSAVPLTAIPGTTFDDTVTLTPPVLSGESPISIPITTTVQGAVLAFDTPPTFAGNSAANETHVIRLKNTGNLPASPTLTIGGTDAALFNVVADLTPSAVAAGSPLTPGQSDYTVRFSPALGDGAVKTASIALAAGSSDIICAPVPTTVALVGEAATPGFRILTPSNNVLAYGNNGNVPCPAGDSGSTPATLTPASTLSVQFANTGSQALTWTGAFANTNGTRFIANTFGGTVAAGDTATINISPLAIPYPPTLASNAYGDTFTITTTNLPGDSPHPIDLQQTAFGASVTAVQDATDFGTIHVGLVNARDPALTLTNSGAGSTTLTLTPTVSHPSGGNAQYSFGGQSGAVPVSLDASATESINGIFAPGNDPVASSVTLAVTADASPLCSPLPGSLTFPGQATDANVSVSQNRVDFVTTFCGNGNSGFPAFTSNPPTPFTFIFSNLGNEDYDITDLVLANGARFDAYIGQQGQRTAHVPKMTAGTPGSAAITVAPKVVPNVSGPVAYPDALTIPFVVAGAPAVGSPKVVPITLTSNCP